MLKKQHEAKTGFESSTWKELTQHPKRKKKKTANKKTKKFFEWNTSARDFNYNQMSPTPYEHDSSINRTFCLLFGCLWKTCWWINLWKFQIKTHKNQFTYTNIGKLVNRMKPLFCCFSLLVAMRFGNKLNAALWKFEIEFLRLFEKDQKKLN